MPPWQMGRDLVGCRVFNGCRTCRWRWRSARGDDAAERRSRLDLLSCAPRLGQTAQGSLRCGTAVADSSSRSQWHTHRATALGLLDRFEPPGSHRFRRYLTGLWWRARFGSAPWPPLKFKVRRFSVSGGPWGVPLPVLQRDAAWIIWLSFLSVALPPAVLRRSARCPPPPWPGHRGWCAPSGCPTPGHGCAARHCPTAGGWVRLHG